MSELHFEADLNFKDMLNHLVFLCWSIVSKGSDFCLIGGSPLSAFCMAVGY